MAEGQSTPAHRYLCSQFIGQNESFAPSQPQGSQEVQYLSFAQKEGKLETFGTLWPPEGDRAGGKAESQLRVKGPEVSMLCWEGQGIVRGEGWLQEAISPRGLLEIDGSDQYWREGQQDRNGRKSSRHDDASSRNSRRRGLFLSNHSAALAGSWPVPKAAE